MHVSSKSQPCRENQMVYAYDIFPAQVNGTSIAFSFCLQANIHPTCHIENKREQHILCTKKNLFDKSIKLSLNDHYIPLKRRSRILHALVSLFHVMSPINNPTRRKHHMSLRLTLGLMLLWKQICSLFH